MADYNINAVTRRVVFSGSAGTGPYAFTFEVLDQTDLAVYFNAAKLTLTTDYTVSVAANGTGSVTIVTGTNVPSTPVAADQITIVGARDIERTTDFVTAGDLRAAALNEQLDGQIIMVQQISEESKRAMRAPVYDPALVEDGGVVNMELPTKASRAGNYLAFDTNGNPTVGVEIGVFRGNWAASTAYALRDIVKDTTNNNIYIATTAHTSSGSLPISSNADVAKWALIVDAASATTSATNAANSATAAATSASNAATSASNAATSETNAGTSETNAASSASAASTSATNASNSASAASTSASNASTSETNAASSASAASTSATNAASSASAASTSATNAANSASAASTSASNAATSETNAAASAASASTSASNASTSASAASTSASDASTSASAASSSAASAAASYDSFDDRYLGAKSSAPALDNDGDALITGALYFDTTAGEMKVYSGTGWVATGSTISSVYQRFEYTASGGETSVTGADDNANTLAYDAGFIMVFLNGVMLNDGDYTATSGSSITGLAALTAGDKLEVIAHGAAAPGDYYSKAASDAKYALLGANTDITSLGSISTVDLNGGTIDGAVIGGSSAAAGSFTTLSASSPISAADGSASAPSVTNTGDTNTGIFFPAADTVGVAVGGTERVTINSTSLTSNVNVSAPNLVTQNLIINPEFMYDQEGYSGTTGIGASTDYVADQWVFTPAGTSSARWTASIEASGGVSGTRPWLKILCTTADASPGTNECQVIQQPLEAQAIQSLLDSSGVGAFVYAIDLIVHADGASSITFPCNVALSCRTTDGTARQFVEDVAVAAADTWQRVYIAVPADSTASIDNNNGQGLEIAVALYGGSGRQVAAESTWETSAGDYITSSTDNLADATNNYIGITAVKLEPGTVATPFVSEDFGEGLRRCLRYWRKAGAGAAGGARDANTVHIGAEWDEMRTAPAATLLINPDVRETTGDTRTGTSGSIVGSDIETTGGFFSINGYSSMTQHNPIVVESPDFLGLSARF